MVKIRTLAGADIGKFRYVRVTPFNDVMLTGPWNDLTELWDPQLIEFRSEMDGISTEGSIFGENQVEHLEHHCDLIFNDFSGSLRPANMGAYYPDAVLAKRSNGSESLIKMGFPVPGTTTRFQETYLGNTVVHFAGRQGDAFVFYCAYPYNVSKPTFARFVNKIVITRNPVTGSYTSYRYFAESSNYVPKDTGLDFTSDHSSSEWDAALSWCYTHGFLSKSSSGGASGSAFDMSRSGPLIIDSLKRAVDAYIQETINADLPFIREKHYGDLAMEASQTVNTTRINMIAFLRDFKDVKSLIPKLSNLKNLKTWAGNYLGTQYGVLPTISDLHEIVAAVKRISPYLDKNGFETYTAGFHDVVTDVTYRVETTQRIKIAIEKEDDLLQLLAHQLERVGMLPNLKNVWDLVPYSFALDWFVEVGELLERVDTRLRLERLNIVYVTMSRKRITSREVLPLVGAPIYGNLKRVHYHRWTSDQCPLPPLSLQTPLTATNHWLEASALLIQRA